MYLANNFDTLSLKRLQFFFRHEEKAASCHSNNFFSFSSGFGLTDIFFLIWQAPSKWQAHSRDCW